MTTATRKFSFSKMHTTFLMVCLVIYLAIASITLITVDYAFSYHYTIYGLLACLYVVGKAYGFTNAAFLLLFFLVYPGFAIIYANIFGEELIKNYNVFLQNDRYLLDVAALYFLVGVTSATFILKKFRWRDEVRSRQVSKQSGFVSRAVAGVACFGIVGLAFVMESGETLLTGSYGEIRLDRTNSSYAGGLFAICWVFAFLGYEKGLFRKLFVICTLIAVVWLLLHGKRAPLLGIAFILLSWFNANGRLTLNKCAYAGVLLLGLFVVGELRSNSLDSYTAKTFFSELSSVRGDAVELPGNGAGIYLTFLGTLSLFETNLPHLYGETYVGEILGVVPDQLLSIIGVAPSLGYGPEVYAEHLPYVGGMHAFSVSYANFGIVGIILIGIGLGFLFLFASRSINSRLEHRRAFAYLIILMAPGALWYNAFIVVSWSSYMAVLIVLLRLFYRDASEVRKRRNA